MIFLRFEGGPEPTPSLVLGPSSCFHFISRFLRQGPEGMIVGAVRAGDYIFSLPQFDKKTYVVRGGSQGGGLAIMTAALDPRVIALASDYPAMSDHFGYLKGPVGGWPHIFADTLIKAKAEKIRKESLDAALEGLGPDGEKLRVILLQVQPGN